MMSLYLLMEGGFYSDVNIEGLMPEGRKCNICHFEKIDFKDF